jgi:hypothetical protein
MSQAPQPRNGPTESPDSQPQRPRIPEVYLINFTANRAQAKLHRNFQRRLVDHMEILVTEAEKRANGTLNIREHFTVYLVETKLVFFIYILS